MVMGLWGGVLRLSLASRVYARGSDLYHLLGTPGTQLSCPAPRPVLWGNTCCEMVHLFKNQLDLTVEHSGVRTQSQCVEQRLVFNETESVSGMTWVH